MYAPPEKSMVLAAGKGSRMRHLTSEKPKPMIEVAGRTLIDYALDRLYLAGVQSCVVNVCGFAEQICEHLLMRELGPTISFSEEEGEPLETGGGVKRALPLLGYEPFYVCNSDPIWTEEGETPALLSLAAAFEPELMDIAILVVPLEKTVGHDGVGDYFIENGKLRRRRADEPSAPYVYAGAQILMPHIFDGVEETKFSLVKLYDVAEKNGRLGFAVLEGTWFHVGTPEALAQAEAMLTVA